MMIGLYLEPTGVSLLSWPDKNVQNLLLIMNKVTLYNENTMDIKLLIMSNIAAEMNFLGWSTKLLN